MVEESMIETEQQYRASAYSLLAALLREAPSPALLQHVRQLSPGDETGTDALSASMTALAEAAEKIDPDQLEDEFQTLFIGVGKGELSPFASWYLTGFLMEQPLSDLRDDLRRLGYERSADTHEPEDHAAAIFEVFSGMIMNASSLDEQRSFFNKHMSPWLGRFFADLGAARSADFYKHVARFGAAFIELERTYLSMRS